MDDALLNTLIAGALGTLPGILTKRPDLTLAGAIGAAAFTLVLSSSTPPEPYLRRRAREVEEERPDFAEEMRRRRKEYWSTRKRTPQL